MCVEHAMLVTPPVPSLIQHKVYCTCQAATPPIPSLIQHKVCCTCQAGYTSSSITGTTQGILHMPSCYTSNSITDTTQGILHMPSWLHLQFHNTRCAGHAKMASPPVPSQIYTTRGVLYIPSWLHLQFYHRCNTRYTVHAKPATPPIPSLIQHKVCCTCQAGYTSSSTTQGVLDMPRWLHLPVPSQIYTTRGVLYIPSWLHLQFHPMQRLLVISTYLSSSIRNRHNERMMGIPSRLHFHFHHTQRESQNGYNFISITGRRCAAHVQLVTRPIPSVFNSTRQLSVTSIRKNTTTVTGIGCNNHHPACD